MISSFEKLRTIFLSETFADFTADVLQEWIVEISSNGAKSEDKLSQIVKLLYQVLKT